MRIPLSGPDITEADIESVVSVLRTSRLSMGPKTEEFEEAVAEVAGARYGIAVSSGTAGLHLGLLALGIGAGDEVILPSFTFIAAGNAVLAVGATPVFADIDPVTLNLNPESVEEQVTTHTRAIIAVHTFGHPADLDPLMSLAHKHGIALIEDACEAIGAKYHGRGVGGIGHLGVFGFYPNKPITTGEGGMVVTSDPDLAEMIRVLRNQGRKQSDGWLDHTLLGYNYRLSEINCALGVSQVARLESILETREAIAIRYAKFLPQIPELIVPPLSIQGGRLCWFVFVIRVANRDRIGRELTARGIGCARYFAPLHLQPLYALYRDRSALPTTEQTAARTLALPFFNALTNAQIEEVCATVAQSMS